MIHAVVRVLKVVVVGVDQEGHQAHHLVVQVGVRVIVDDVHRVLLVGVIQGGERVERRYPRLRNRRCSYRVRRTHKYIESTLLV